MEIGRSKDVVMRRHKAALARQTRIRKIRKKQTKTLHGQKKSDRINYDAKQIIQTKGAK